MIDKSVKIKYKRLRDIPSRIVDGEAVLVTPKEGKVTVLNETAARIWQLLDGTHKTVSEIAKYITTEFEIEEENAYRDCFDFLKTLEEKGFIQSEP